jgi:hypothetical protein
MSPCGLDFETPVRSVEALLHVTAFLPSLGERDRVTDLVRAALTHGNPDRYLEGWTGMPDASTSPTPGSFGQPSTRLQVTTRRPPLIMRWAWHAARRGDCQ